MTASESVKEIMKKHGVSQELMAKRAGYKYQSNVTGILNRGASMRVDNLLKMINAMGCELIIRDRKDGDEWTVDE